MAGDKGANKDLEREKFKFESKWTPISIIASTIIAVLGLSFNVWSVQRQQAADFQLKAEEIVMNTDSPEAALDKAKALVALFPGQLPPDFADRLRSGNFGRPDPLAKERLLQMLADHPGKEQEIIAMWRSLFPNDTWVGDLIKTVQMITTPAPKGTAVPIMATPTPTSTPTSIFGNFLTPGPPGFAGESIAIIPPIPVWSPGSSGCDHCVWYVDPLRTNEYARVALVDRPPDLGYTFGKKWLIVTLVAQAPQNKIVPINAGDLNLKTDVGAYKPASVWQYTGSTWQQVSEVKSGTRITMAYEVDSNVQNYWFGVGPNFGNYLFWLR